MQNPRNLRVWRYANELALAVRRETRMLPRSGCGPLHSQLTRAAESIPLNISEGCGAGSQRDFAHFLTFSIRSTLELETALALANGYGVLGERMCGQLTTDVTTVRRMLYGLRSKVLASDEEQTQLLSAARAHRKRQNEKRGTENAKRQDTKRRTQNAQRRTDNAKRITQNG